jgi:hypothetical protein
LNSLIEHNPTAAAPQFDKTAPESDLQSNGVMVRDPSDQSIDLLRPDNAGAFDDALDDLLAWGTLSECVDPYAFQHGSSPHWLPEDAGLVELASGDAASFMLPPETGEPLTEDKGARDDGADSVFDPSVGLFQAFELASLPDEGGAGEPPAEPTPVDARVVIDGLVNAPLISSKVPNSQEDAHDAALRYYYFTGVAAMLIVSGRLMYGHISDRSAAANLSPLHVAGEDCGGFPGDRATIC